MQRFLLGAALLAVAGCGDSGPKTYPVTGAITIGGQPASGVSITFQPVDAGLETAAGQVDAQGKYTLYTGAAGKQGAQAGKYKVVLTQIAQSSNEIYQKGARGGGVPGLPPRSFPDEWGTGNTSPKEVEVKAESNVIDIEVPARN